MTMSTALASRSKRKDLQGTIMNDFVVAADPAEPPKGLESAVYAIGNFDGMHLGHQAVVKRTVALAREISAPCALLTFEPHPADYFAERPVAFRLTSPEMKARIARQLGLSGIVFLSFNASLASMSAEEFVVEILVKRLRVGAVVIGWDFHFGKGRAGTPSYLVEAGDRYGFGVDIVAKVEEGSVDFARVVSSTAIRRALEQGDVEAAAHALGRLYSVSGIVISGQRLGRTLGVPTANIALEATSRLAHGVYAVLANVDGKAYRGVASFGVPADCRQRPPAVGSSFVGFRGESLRTGHERRIRAANPGGTQIRFPGPPRRRNGA